jgi:hypothetical protein
MSQNLTSTPKFNCSVTSHSSSSHKSLFLTASPSYKFPASFEVSQPFCCQISIQFVMPSTRYSESEAIVIVAPAFFVPLATLQRGDGCS